MTTRVLPAAEYPRLVGTEAEAVWPHLRPTDRVVVVERDGEIVACHVLMQLWHVECLWVHPEHRKAMVGGRLWAAMRNEIADVGAHGVLTAALSDDVKELIAHVGGVPLPGEHFVIPAREDRCPH